MCSLRKGDPLGPLLFALALQPIIQELNDKLRTWQKEMMNNANTELLLFVFYLDDVILIGRHELLQKAIEFLGSDKAVSRGLYFCVRNITCGGLRLRLHRLIRTIYLH